ncbi:MAG: hypothetical protein ABH874_03140 [Methanobacteriota archaeon]
MPATPEDRMLLLLSIKETGKIVDFEHIAEKIIRDGKEISENEVKKILDELIYRKLISEKQNGYVITEKGIRKIRERLGEVGSELNLSYRMVLKAKDYYPKAAEALVPFLEGRATSVVKIFSDENNPVNKIKPLFVRYARYKPEPVFIQITSEEELLRYVDAHAVDFIPYIHKLDASQPDWFVLDLDAGQAFKNYAKGFELLKMAAEKVAEVLEECEIIPNIKFSGSRGVQIWSKLDNSKLHADLFALYRRLAVAVQERAEKKIQELPNKILEEFYRIVGKGKPVTTSTVAKKEERADQILIDWSSMKINGDVRAPFSIHYKTGLVSCPIERKRLLEFQTSEAEPEKVAENIERLANAFRLEISDPSLLMEELK